jgi:hypothetical protein
MEMTLLDGPGGWVQADIRRDGEIERVWLRLQLDRPGNWQLQGALYVDGLTPENVRTLPLRRILAAVAASPHLRRELTARLDQSTSDPGSGEFRKSFSGFVHPEPALKLERPAGYRLSDDFYGAVAEAYRTALARGLNPRPAIAEAADVSTDVAGRWVREARKRGLLPATTPGKVGV